MLVFFQIIDLILEVYMHIKFVIVLIWLVGWALYEITITCVWFLGLGPSVLFLQNPPRAWLCVDDRQGFR